MPILRRDLLGRLIGLGSIATLSGILTPAAGFLMPLRSGVRGGNILEGADGEPIDPEDLPEGSGLVGRLRGRPTLAVRKNGQLLGFSAVCTHLGCVVRWNETSGWIECPCHGGRFDLRGQVLTGPPPSGLDAIPLKIEGDRIVRA